MVLIVLIASLLFKPSEGKLLATHFPPGGPLMSFNKDFLQKQDYDKLTSPFELTGQIQSYYVNPNFVILAAVDENKQSVTYIAEINITWHDPRLEFDPNVMGYTTVVVRSELLWLPPVNTFNAAGITFLDTVYSSFDARVTYLGWASYILKGKIETVCMVDVVNFPFDEQFCNIDFDGGVSTAEFAMLYPGNVTPLVYGLPEWDIYNPSVQPVIVPSNPSNYSCIVITFKMKRNPQFYIYFLILPTVTITFTCMAALLLPLDMSEGERVNLGIAGLLGLTFMLSIIVSEVPRSSSLPLIGKWLIVQMFYCITAMLWEIPCQCLLRILEKRMSIGWLKGDRVALLVHAVSSVLLIGSNLLVTVLMFEIISTPSHLVDADHLL